VLLDFKAYVNYQDRGMGLTSVMAAAEYGRVDCMRLLLEKNADVALAEATRELEALDRCQSRCKPAEPHLA
jgi:ankyrin repeat protein